MELKKCSSLDEIRKEIDKLDTQIVELIGARNGYIKQAALFKHTVDEVKDKDRIDFVIDKIRQEAIRFGVSPNLLTKLYNIMIDEMVETEVAEFNNTKSL
jgi:isochorismate pyruvate lyase